MSYEQRDNSGSLFKNDRKEKDTHPDFNGSARIDGHDYWISAWTKESNGKKFFSFSFKRKDGTSARPEKQGSYASSKKAGDDPFGLGGDEIPFAPEFC